MTRRKPIAAPEAGQLVEDYLDHPAVGCGWRRYLVLRAGPKWVRLLSVSDAVALSIPREDFRGLECVLKPTRQAKRLRQVAESFGRSDTGDVKLALQLLRNAKATACPAR